MSKKFKGMEHQMFVLCDDGLHIINNGGSIVLSESYYDASGNVTGKQELVKYVTAKSRDGRDVGKRFRFDESFRRVLTRESDKDFNGVKQYDWLKNHPQCEGSPNGDYKEVDGEYVQIGVWFRELDSAKDAEVALEADEQRITAQASALELDAETLQEVGSILGHFGNPDKLMRLRVVEYAGKKPKHFNEILAANDRMYRSLVKRGLNEGILKQKGSVIYWHETIVGSDEESAVATLIRDKAIYNALSEKLKPKSVEKESKSSDEPVKKQRGNPNFKKQKLDDPVQSL